MIIEQYVSESLREYYKPRSEQIRTTYFQCLKEMYIVTIHKMLQMKFVNF